MLNSSSFRNADLKVTKQDRLKYVLPILRDSSKNLKTKNGESFAIEPSTVFRVP